MTKIIAFAGRKQSGKTTCSEFVEKYFNGTIEPYNGAKIYNFADILKQEICINILGLTYDQCYGTDEDKNSITDIDLDGKKLSAREVMQYVGTDIFRKMKPNVWADATINKIINENKQLAIIADCRFPNEVEAVKKAGGMVIKLMRDPFHSTHESETALDTNKYNHSNFDFIVMNNEMTVDDQLIAIMKYLRKKEVLL